MKTIKFITPSEEIKITKSSSFGNWFYKIAVFSGVFFAAFFSIVIFNSQFNTNQPNIAKAQVQQNSEIFYNDVNKFVQWLDIVRQNAWNNQPLLQPIKVYNYLDPNDIQGLTYPVAGSSLPLDKPDYLPNSPRTYRNGIHEGVDFAASSGTKIKSVWAGKIVRIDKSFKDTSESEYQKMIERSFKSSTTPQDVLDRIRGRQIWIDHGNGVVTRYCHLSEVNNNLVLGQVVNKGDYIGKAGKSGLMWEGFGAHLHFEIRIGEKFLGQGKNYQTLKELYSKAFAVL